MFKWLKKTLIGTPIPTFEAGEERLTKVRALPVFASDALSSIAYASEEILLVLMIAGSQALGYSVPLSIAIVALLVLVVISYRQTIYAYPTGGGAYSVAKENLGEKPGLVAGSALLIDYVLTVAVSVSSGVAAITSAFPSLHGHKILLAYVAIGILTVCNLRGIRESAKIFMFPTYAFVLSSVLLLISGLFQLFLSPHGATPPPALPVQHPLTLFLILRAFSSGCTAMTGVEAVSNGVRFFRKPESRNAARTLFAMSGILVTIFIGVTYLAHVNGIVPIEHETVLSQLARITYGDSIAYYIVQFTTMGILLLAANTSYAGFPPICSMLARDRFLPRQLASQGDRLVFSNGILALTFFSALLIWLFNADTHALIPLYAVGVFLSFTLSQSGMVVHWFRCKGPRWRNHAAVNLIGAVTTGVVALIFVITKFSQGAWIITVLIPFLVFIFLGVHRHYLRVGRQLSMEGVDPSRYKSSPKHTVVVPLSGIHRGVLEALRYARSISNNIRAVYIEIDPNYTENLRRQWKEFGQGIHLEVLHSPYRSVIAPLLQYIDELDERDPDDLVTVVIPEFVTERWWQNLLHNQTALLIRAALAFKRNKVVTTVRYHLREQGI